MLEFRDVRSSEMQTLHPNLKKNNLIDEVKNNF